MGREGGGVETRTVLWQENLKEQDHLEDQDVEGRLALNGILQQHVQGLGLDLLGLGWQKSLDCFSSW